MIRSWSAGLSSDSGLVETLARCFLDYLFWWYLIGYMSTTKAKPSKLPFPFRPNGSTVLAKVLDVTEKSREGIIEIPNPNYASQQTVRAEVLAVGAENKNCKVGDIIMIHKMVGNEILLQGEGFKIIRAEDIVGFYE